MAVLTVTIADHMLVKAFNAGAYTTLTTKAFVQSQPTQHVSMQGASSATVTVTIHSRTTTDKLRAIAEESNDLSNWTSANITNPDPGTMTASFTFNPTSIGMAYLRILFLIDNTTTVQDLEQAVVSCIVTTS